MPNTKPSVHDLESFTATKPDPCPKLFPQRVGINTTFQVLFASMVGTTIEFFDFYLRHGVGIPAVFSPEAIDVAASD